MFNSPPLFHRFYSDVIPLISMDRLVANRRTKVSFLKKCSLILPLERFPRKLPTHTTGSITATYPHAWALNKPSRTAETMATQFIAANSAAAKNKNLFLTALRLFFSFAPRQRFCEQTLLSVCRRFMAVIFYFIMNFIPAPSWNRNFPVSLPNSARSRARTNSTMRSVRDVATSRPAAPPFTLLDYFPEDFLLIIDESHVTIPQVRAMYAGDLARKTSLVDYGFRIPSAFDNRPLKFDEFESRIRQTIYVSATPGPYELGRTKRVVEQIIRPTGLIDPEIDLRLVKGQVDDLLSEARAMAEKGYRTLVTTLTKRMAESLTDYLDAMGLKVRYMHSDIETLERMEIIRGLRLGEFDVLVGINLLREGLDLPEVGLVAIFDADKEGFLRSTTSLIQTVGRAARNVDGRVIMYADLVTDSMRRALDETERRRQKQLAYNKEHNITPRSTKRTVGEVLAINRPVEEGERKAMPKFSEDVEARILVLEQQMQEAAMSLEFEQAATLRDQIKILRGEKVEKKTQQRKTYGRRRA